MKTALISFLAANLIRGLRATVRLRFHGDERVRGWERTETRFILAFWHRHLLLMPYAYRGKRISVLVNGALLTEGPPEQVARDPQVKAVYLGEAADA